MELKLSTARWIGVDGCASPIIVRRFTVSKPSAAELLVTGLGWFEAYINGQPVSFDKLQPVASDYERRHFTKITYPCRDTFTHRVYYCSYDVSSLVREGENTLELQLGGGWYRQNERIAEGEMSYSDTLKAIYSLGVETDSGVTVINSDGSETWHSSEILYSNLFIGELHDRTAPISSPAPVKLLPPPDALLTKQQGAPDRVVRTIIPCAIARVDGRTIYDAGENVSGVVRVTMSGGKATLRFAENIKPDGSLNFASTGYSYTCKSGRPQLMTDTFIGSGVFEPKFTWHCFRYFDVEGELDSAEVLVIHSDTPVTSSFDSSSEGLNFLYDAFIRTQLDNMHGSFPSDCPHRERLGYTGDGQNCAEAGMLLLDSREFYRKWIRDILDCQDSTSGHVQHTAPFQGGGGGPGGWGCAMIIVPYAYYLSFGETSMLEQCYEPMRRWVDYLVAHSENGLVVREEEGGWCLGEWFTLEKCAIPEPFVNTCFFVRCLRIMTIIAQILGRYSDISEYERLDSLCCAALKETYLDDGHFCGGIQGADAYALSLGIAPAGALEALVKKYDQLGHFDTGFLGTDRLLEVLFENGYESTALRLLESDELGSFLYMKRHGATTVWENWRGDASHCHPMFGGCTRFLFKYILGIRQQNAGYESISIKPQLPDGLARASGSIATVRGRISVAWERLGERVRFDITLPSDISADFVLGETRLTLKPGRQTIIA